MARLTSYDHGNGEILVNEEERLLSSKGFMDKEEMYKIMRHLAEKLYEYEEAAEQHMLLRLHCKVGDKLWAITTTINYSLGAYSEVLLKDPQEKKIQSITISKNGLGYHVNGRTYGAPEFGKTVFLTREEAEQAIAEIRERDREV